MAPACEPVQQLGIGKNQSGIRLASRSMRIREPLNKFPICWRELLLLMGSARRQFEDVLQVASFLACARPHQMKLHSEPMARRLLGIGFGETLDSQAARGASKWVGLGGKSQSSSCFTTCCSSAAFST